MSRWRSVRTSHSCSFTGPGSTENTKTKEVFQCEPSANWTLNSDHVDPVCGQRGTRLRDCEHRAQETAETLLRLSGDKESPRCLHH
ncbi:hypothetical protein Q5P01_013897 [Channa striata]|uniref:Uncharacterized protein n=1 Tax=Channa striata TaxID=64152 RepID=A0AA88MN96_CHASR|nr:hypothetical protein Q5P01_013897 [Channa striata]